MSLYVARNRAVRRSRGPSRSLPRPRIGLRDRRRGGRQRRPWAHGLYGGVPARRIQDLEPSRDAAVVAAWASPAGR